MRHLFVGVASIASDIYSRKKVDGHLITNIFGNLIQDSKSIDKNIFNSSDWKKFIEICHNFYHYGQEVKMKEKQKGVWEVEYDGNRFGVDEIVILRNMRKTVTKLLGPSSNYPEESVSK